MGTGVSRTVFAPVSHQKARISFDLHGCVTWMSMPRTALEPLDRSSQPARLVVLDDPRLQVDLVDHRSLAGCSMHNLGSGQRVAARARWRGRASRRTSAIELSCSGGATMCCRSYADRAANERVGPKQRLVTTLPRPLLGSVHGDGVGWGGVGTQHDLLPSSHYAAPRRRATTRR